ncbi:hypothetical protein [Streptomyces axinellae]|uniref:Uncharacterized protein n=1 Tax=Streptomyces axinellae TaxID=552788 RepID=A0ABN3QWM9_9ACTN
MQLETVGCASPGFAWIRVTHNFYRLAVRDRLELGEICVGVFQSLHDLQTGRLTEGLERLDKFG